MLILHYTGMRDEASAFDWLADPASQVSCHYFVFEDGRVVQMVPEARRAWHAGRSCWAGVRDINSHSIGIEIANPGHEWGYRPFPAAQLDAVAALCRDIVTRWAIPARNVLAHSDVAPMRKEDPGELFDWRRLAEQGVGLVVGPAPLADGAPSSTADLQAKLAALGYEIEPTGLYDAWTETVVRAFQRHFRQERVDGVADPSTVATLDALLARISQAHG